MATVNIRRDVTDPFYRYKMEKLQSKIEGKGNGIKTVIVNLNSVAQSLSRPPAYVIKYFGFELGAQANAKPTDERWIINGAHDAAKLQDYLDGFISKFVLCKKCKNPETDVSIKDEKIILDCKACGQRTDVDPRLKLSTFIVRNNPKGGKKDKKDKKARREAKKEKSQANGDQDASPGDSNGSEHDDENGDEAIEAGSDDELTRQAQAIEVEAEIKDDDWAVDLSEEAVKARARNLPSDLKRSLVIENADDDQVDGLSSYEQLGKWIVDTAAERGSVDEVSDDDIKGKAKELGILSKHKTCAVLAQSIFDENIVKQIKPREKLLQELVTSERHEKAFLGGTERFVGEAPKTRMPRVPAILHGYYDAEIVTEETLQAWGAKASKKYVDMDVSKEIHKSAKPFLEWLENADEESEDEDDE
jgi:translation initiation factor 5